MKSKYPTVINRSLRTTTSSISIKTTMLSSKSKARQSHRIRCRARSQTTTHRNTMLNQLRSTLLSSSSRGNLTNRCQSLIMLMSHIRHPATVRTRCRLPVTWSSTRVLSTITMSPHSSSLLTTLLAGNSRCSNQMDLITPRALHRTKDLLRDTPIDRTQEKSSTLLGSQTSLPSLKL